MTISCTDGFVYVYLEKLGSALAWIFWAGFSFYFSNSNYRARPLSHRLTVKQKAERKPIQLTDGQFMHLKFQEEISSIYIDPIWILDGS